VYNLISDCWASYFNGKFKFKHSICDGHILRELVAAAYFRQQAWAIEMFDLLLEVLSAKTDAVDKKEKSLSQEYIDDIRKRYRQIVADGFSENAGGTKGKTIALLERLRKLEDSALAFAIDFSVDFTNNVSEQSLRNLKVVLRVIGQFKTMPGLVDYCIIQSFMDTCRKQGHNPFDMMRIVLSGGDIIGAVFGAEKAAQIKLMNNLADAYAGDDEDEINAAAGNLMHILTDELIAAAQHGRFSAYNEPPPQIKNSEPAISKDKMKAAREKMRLDAQTKDKVNPAAVSQDKRAGPARA
jgi:transposase